MNNALIMKEINKIISFCMVKGVQPSELAASIFESEYHHIESYKEGDKVVFVLSFIDRSEDDVSNIKMKYVYNESQQLISVNQKVNSGPYKIQWDRNQTLTDMLKSLAQMAPGDTALIDKLKDAIPNEFKDIVYPHLKLVS
ncbi:hypothetical protein D6089_20475 [Vibrio vulnificus]|nr:hypothetical protein [Vibrio vulnificus]